MNRVGVSGKWSVPVSSFLVAGLLAYAGAFSVGKLSKTTPIDLNLNQFKWLTGMDLALEIPSVPSAIESTESAANLPLAKTDRVKVSASSRVTSVPQKPRVRTRVQRSAAAPSSPETRKSVEYSAGVASKAGSIQTPHDKIKSIHKVLSQSFQNAVTIQTKNLSIHVSRLQTKLKVVSLVEASKTHKTQAKPKAETVSQTAEIIEISVPARRLVLRTEPQVVPMASTARVTKEKPKVLAKVSLKTGKTSQPDPAVLEANSTSEVTSALEPDSAVRFQLGSGLVGLKDTASSDFAIQGLAQYIEKTKDSEANLDSSLPAQMNIQGSTAEAERSEFKGKPGANHSSGALDAQDAHSEMTSQSLSIHLKSLAQVGASGKLNTQSQIESALAGLSTQNGTSIIQETLGNPVQGATAPQTQTRSSGSAATSDLVESQAHQIVETQSNQLSADRAREFADGREQVVGSSHSGHSGFESAEDFGSGSGSAETGSASATRSISDLKNGMTNGSVGAAAPLVHRSAQAKTPAEVRGSSGLARNSGVNSIPDLSVKPSKVEGEGQSSGDFASKQFHASVISGTEQKLIDATSHSSGKGASAKPQNNVERTVKGDPFPLRLPEDTASTAQQSINRDEFLNQELLRPMWELGSVEGGDGDHQWSHPGLRIEKPRTRNQLGSEKAVARRSAKQPGTSSRSVRGLQAGSGVTYQTAMGARAPGEFSEDWLSVGSENGWMIFSSEEFFPTLRWSSQFDSAVPVLHENTLRHSAGMVGVEIRDGLGLVYGRVLSGWTMSFSGRNQDFLFFDENWDPVAAPSGVGQNGHVSADAGSASGLPATVPDGAYYYLLYNVEPSAHSLALAEPRTQKIGSVHFPVLADTATMMNLHRPNTFAEVDGYVYQATAPIDEDLVGLDKIKVSIVGSGAQEVQTDEEGFFRFEGLVTFSDYPLYVDTTSIAGYRLRHRLTPDSFDQVVLPYLERAEVEQLIEEIPGGRSLNSGLVLGWFEQALGSEPSEEKTYSAKIQSLDPTAPLEPRVYGLYTDASEAGLPEMNDSPILESLLPRFLATAVPEGFSMVEIRDPESSTLIHSETVLIDSSDMGISQDPLISVVGLH